MLHWSQAPQEEHSSGEGVERQQPGQQEEELLGEGDGAVDQPVGQLLVTESVWTQKDQSQWASDGSVVCGCMGSTCRTLTVL